MIQRGFMKLKNIKDLNSYIDRIYEQKETLMNDALKEINSAYGHLLEEEDSESEDEWGGLQQAKKSIAAPKKPSRVSRKKEPTAAPNATFAVRKSSRTSNSNYQSALNSTCYLDAVGETEAEVKTPFKPDSDQVDNERVVPPPHVPKNRIGLLHDETVSKPKFDVSYIKSSIATADIINPIGSSTPGANSLSSPNSSDDEIEPKSNFKDHDGLVEKLNKQDLKSETAFVKPSPIIAPSKNAVAKLKTTKFDDAQKKKTIRMNEVVEAKKRKREERTQKVAAQLAKVSEAREKRQVVLKYEKKKEDEKSKVQKQKETKSKTTQKKAETKDKEQLRVKKEDILEYKIDHIVDGASSEDEDKPKHQVPKWATEEQREYPANVQAWLDKKDTVYKWFFSERLKTPILEELFSTGVRMRTRTSSAVWHR